MCKKIISILLIITLLLLLNCNSFAKAIEPNISAKAAILMIADSGEIIYNKNVDKQMPMASTTKIMTTLIALENGDFSKKYTVTSEMVNVEGTSAGLKAGDKIDLQTLLYCMMLSSGNDAANATACVVCDSVEKFISLMNKKAKEIGMTHTNFDSVSGLDTDNHCSTAYDMALLTSYALKNEQFEEICSTYTKSVSFGNPPYNRRLTNHNKLLKYYDGLIGVKTGFTKKSGRCLVTAARRNGLTLICVTLNDGNDWEDHENLLDYGFEKVKKQSINQKIEIEVPVIDSIDRYVDAEIEHYPSVYTYSNDVDLSINYEIESFLYPPIKYGDIVGYASIYYKNGNLIEKVPLISRADIKQITVENKNKSLFKRIIMLFKGE